MRDKGWGRQSPNTYNAACGIETFFAASAEFILARPNTHYAAGGIETLHLIEYPDDYERPNTHNAAGGIETVKVMCIGSECPKSQHTLCCVRY